MFSWFLFCKLQKLPDIQYGISMDSVYNIRILANKSISPISQPKFIVENICKFSFLSVKRNKVIFVSVQKLFNLPTYEALKKLF